MFETSKDLLFIAGALAIGGLALFTSVAIYYLAMILRQVLKAVKEMRERFYKVDTVIDKVQQKLDHSTSHLLLVAEGIKKLVEIAKNHTEKKEKKSKKK